MKQEKKDRESIKKDIRTAAMELIGKEGFSGVTARKIGEFMGLKNVSLVNYYFGSKEELILETLKKNYFDVMTEVFYSMSKYENSRDKLVALFEKMMEIFLKYPALIKLFYFDEIKRSGNIKDEYIEELTKLQSEIVERNFSLVKQVTDAKSDEKVWLKLYQLRGAMMFPPLAEDTYPELQKYFNNYENRKCYVDDIVDGICRRITKSRDS